MESKRIQIFDTTLRDGEQVPGCGLNKDQKLKIALALEGLGVDVIEAGFPISSPGDFESVQSIARAIKNTTVCALSRAVKADIEAAGSAIKDAKRGRIHTGIGTSDIHIKHKFNSDRETIIERAVWAVKEARKYAEDVEFYAEDAGRTDNEYLSQVAAAVIKAGATVFNVPDTTGYCIPEEYGEKIKYLMENTEGIHKITISAHCHNDLGLATANTLAAVQNGARQVECTINGIGERAGNTSMEEIVMVLKKHNWLDYQTNIKTELFCPMSELVAETMKMSVQPNKAIVGSNAFAHSSGIHQDGVIKNRENYEIMDPKEVGVNFSTLVMTARSGRSALRYKLEHLKVEYQSEDLEDIYTHFLEVADSEKTVSDSRLVSLAENVLQKKVAVPVNR